MKEEVTVIIGAGVIGLCTAFHLANPLRTRSKIYVVEVFDDVFQATSATNTGILHHVYPSDQEKLTSLGTCSWEIWEKLSHDFEFAESTGWSPNTAFSAREGSGKGQEKLPEWIRLDPSWDVDGEPNGADAATINSVGLGQWLAKQCRARGVEIITGAQVTRARLSRQGQIQAIQWKNKAGLEHFLTCNALVVAAGPWSAQVLTDLFPYSSVDLKLRANASDWLFIENPMISEGYTRGAVLLEEAVGHKLEFAARNDGMIWACGRRIYDAELCPIGEHAEPDLDELMVYAEKFIRAGDESNTRIKIIKKGRSFRPGTAPVLPTISAVPGRLLSKSRATTPYFGMTSGVYISTGHSSWGVGLGMGSGKVLAQLMRGERPDVDLSDFTLK